MVRDDFDGLGLNPAGARRQSHGSLSPWDVNNQLFRLTNPVSDPAGVCSREYLLGLADEDVSDQSSAGCLMARARNETVCRGEDNPFATDPAQGDMVSRAMNRRGVRAAVRRPAGALNRTAIRGGAADALPGLTRP